MFEHITYRPKQQNTSACNKETHVGHLFKKDSDSDQYDVHMICKHAPSCILPFQEVVKVYSLGNSMVGEVDVPAPVLSEYLLWFFNLIPMPLRRRLNRAKIVYRPPKDTKLEELVVKRSKLKPKDILPGSGAGEWCKLAFKRNKTIAGTFYARVADLEGGRYARDYGSHKAELESVTHKEQSQSFVLRYCVVVDVLYLDIQVRLKQHVKYTPPNPKKGELTDAESVLNRLLTGDLIRLEMSLGVSESEKGAHGTPGKKLRALVNWLVHNLPSKTIVGK